MAFVPSSRANWRWYSLAWAEFFRSTFASIILSALAGETAFDRSGLDQADVDADPPAPS